MNTPLGNAGADASTLLQATNTAQVNAEMAEINAAECVAATRKNVMKLYPKEDEILSKQMNSWWKSCIGDHRLQMSFRWLRLQ